MSIPLTVDLKECIEMVETSKNPIQKNRDEGINNDNVELDIEIKTKGKEKQNMENLKYTAKKQISWILKNLGYILLFLAVVVWLFFGILWYYFYEKWTFSEAFYYTVNCGLSIGFGEGLLSDTNDASRIMACILVFFGSTLIVGALSIFTSFVFEQKNKVTKEHYVQKINDLKKKQGDHYMIVEESLPNKVYYQVWTPLKKLYTSHEAIFKATILLGLWLTLGAAVVRHRYQWTIIQSIYFAITAMSTGGLQSLVVNEEDPANSGWAFVGFFALIGVPLYAYSMGVFASAMLEWQTRAVNNIPLEDALSEEDFLWASNLLSNDGQMDFGEFLCCELLRLGVLDKENIELMKEKFNCYDKSGDGQITLEEIRAENERVRNLKDFDPLASESIDIGGTNQKRQKRMSVRID